MKNYIYSKTTDKGQQSFFLVVNGQEYYLFTQKFYRGVKNYFQNKVLLSKAIDFSSANNDTALLRTMEKLPAHIRYVENEYGIIALNKTARKTKQYKVNQSKWLTNLRRVFEYECA